MRRGWVQVDRGQTVEQATLQAEESNQTPKIQKIGYIKQRLESWLRSGSVDVGCMKAGLIAGQVAAGGTLSPAHLSHSQIITHAHTGSEKPGKIKNLILREADVDNDNSFLEVLQCCPCIVRSFTQSCLFLIQFPPERLKVTGSQCWFLALFLTCRDFFGFSDDIMDCKR